MTKFIPVANPEDVLQQGSLHKKEHVDNYDPTIFENNLGGKNKHNTKSRKQILLKNKKLKNKKTKRNKK
jgi:hypothetical protein